MKYHLFFNEQPTLNSAVPRSLGGRAGLRALRGAGFGSPGTAQRLQTSRAGSVSRRRRRPEWGP